MSFSVAEAIAEQIESYTEITTVEDCEMLILQLSELRTMLLRKASRALKIGDRVRLRNIKPKYLDGAPGTLTGRRGTKLLVTIDPHYNTRRYSHAITVPAGTVGPLED